MLLVLVVLLMLLLVLLVSQDDFTHRDTCKLHLELISWVV